MFDEMLGTLKWNCQQKSKFTTTATWFQYCLSGEVTY